MTNVNGSTRQPRRARVRLFLAAVVRERLSVAAVYCRPGVSLAYQRVAQRHVLRGIESGGAVRELGHYVVFCDRNGEAIPWLQPLEAITANGPHAVIVAPSLVGVEVFRVERTYCSSSGTKRSPAGTANRHLCFRRWCSPDARVTCHWSYGAATRKPPGR